MSFGKVSLAPQFLLSGRKPKRISTFCRAGPRGKAEARAPRPRARGRVQGSAPETQARELWPGAEVPGRGASARPFAGAPGSGPQSPPPTLIRVLQAHFKLFQKTNDRKITLGKLTYSNTRMARTAWDAPRCTQKVVALPSPFC